MARKPEVHFYTVPRADIEKMAVEDVLDMLRYDGAQVISNAPEGFYLFRVEGKEPEVARWRSFGVKTLRRFDAARWQHSDEPFLKELWARA